MEGLLLKCKSLEYCHIMQIKTCYVMLWLKMKSKLFRSLKRHVVRSCIFYIYIFFWGGGEGKVKNFISLVTLVFKNREVGGGGQ